MRRVVSDEELMVQVQAGDEGALAQLMDRYRGPLYGFLHRRFEASATDDLFQETWLRVVRARRRFDPSRRFSTWLFQIANNLCRDLGRRRAVDARRRSAAAQEARVSQLRDAPTPADLSLDVRRRVAALPDRLREVLMLRYFAGLPEAEIAAIAGIPRGTVKSRLHAAVRALRGQEEREDER